VRGLDGEGLAIDLFYDAHTSVYKKIKTSLDNFRHPRADGDPVNNPDCDSRVTPLWAIAHYSPPGRGRCKRVEGKILNSPSSRSDFLEVP